MMQKVNIDEDVSINSMPSIESASSHAGNLRQEEEEHAEQHCMPLRYSDLSPAFWLKQTGGDDNNGVDYFQGNSWFLSEYFFMEKGAEVHFVGVFFLQIFTNLFKKYPHEVYFSKNSMQLSRTEILQLHKLKLPLSFLAVSNNSFTWSATFLIKLKGKRKREFL